MLPGLFYDQGYLVHYFPPLAVLVSLSLATTKGRTKMFICNSCEDVPVPVTVQNFSFTIIRDASAYNAHKMSSSFIILLCKAIVCTEGSDERKQTGYLNLWLLCCKYMGLRMWGQEGSVCL